MTWRSDRSTASTGVQVFLALILLTFAGLAVHELVRSGSLEINDEGITYRRRFAQYRINWSEVTHLEMDPQGFRIVFCGENKRLAAFGPLYWSRDNKKQLLNWLGTQVDARGITVRPTDIAMYRLSKNTKVRA